MKPQPFCIVFFALLVFHMTAVGQTPWSWTLSEGPEVTNGEATMPHPFTGGLSAPQWSEIDMDWDGDMDLFAFDRDGSRVLVFEKTETENWKERPDWSAGWPAHPLAVGAGRRSQAALPCAADGRFGVDASHAGLTC